ncbi:MAG TPA: pyrroloquinoline quinone-dependent dehydrogenase [Steroidobacteraceae bacterium]|nr:pyrroloquinoline quinone-dependent dehydrogenase [Steroidobacteraceae bacterium]
MHGIARTHAPVTVLALLAIASVVAPHAARAQSPDASDWGYYGGDVFGERYSSLAQIDRTNVDKLQVAWTFRTGEMGEGVARAGKLTFEVTPVLAFGSLYLETATNIVFALDPETGKARWRYDPRVDRQRRFGEASARGVTLWEDPAPERQGPCKRRVFTGTLDARLLALDAMTGKPCAGFGTGGAVDLTQGMRIRDRGDYVVTSPPAIFNGVVIIGSAIGDNRAVDLERGTIRAYDAVTGAPLWAFDPIPDSPTHPAAGGWVAAQASGTGAANAWAVMTVDPDRGTVFVPTSSASPDFFGGARVGDNRFANSLLALDAMTGKLLWHQQLVHHDLWDYDLAAQPILVEMERRGVPVNAVLQATKTGMLFGFDRDSGKPLFPIAEQSVPKSLVPGEHASPTQPFSSLPPLVEHRPLKKDDAWGLTFWDRGKCRDSIKNHRNEGVYTPPDTRGTILWPSDLGGVNWSGIAFDTRRQRVVAAVNHLAMVVTLVPQEEMARQRESGEYPRSEFAQQEGAPYGMRREPLLSPWGLPCTAPPWGTLVNVDLRENRIVWQVPLGSTENLAPWFIPVRNFGTPNLGGPIITAGDLVFVGAAMDRYMRAFDLETGRELWKHALPAGGQATPMTYRAGKSERQYVVIAAGGHGPLGVPRGDYVVAFALPK